MKIYIITHTDTSHWKRKGNRSQSPNSTGRRWEGLAASSPLGAGERLRLAGNPQPHRLTLCSLGSHCSQCLPQGSPGGRGHQARPEQPVDTRCSPPARTEQGQNLSCNQLQRRGLQTQGRSFSTLTSVEQRFWQPEDLN